MDREEKILDYLENNSGKGINQIIEDLGLSKKTKKKTRKLLQKLEEEGKITEVKGGGYTVEKSELLKGKVKIIKNKFAFVDGDEESVFIPPRKINGAMTDDIVLVKIDEEKSSGDKKEGEIVQILERGKQTIIGIFEEHEQFGFVFAMGNSLQDIYVNRRNFNRAKNNELVVVEIYSWGDKDKKPEGKIIKKLGNPYDSDTRLEALILEKGYTEDFSSEIKKELAVIKNKKEEVSKKRIDLTDLDFITIDGEDAKDLDDAVYLEKMEDGNYKLMVSIADVSYYVKKNSLLDEEAQKRGNSVYLVDRVIPMLPRELSNGLCSLNQGEKKYTFTAEIKLDKTGKILSEKTYKSEIKTVERMTYKNVNRILDKDSEMLERYQEIVGMLENMEELAQLIRAKRIERGAINFDMPETKVILNEAKKVKEIKLRERGEAEKIIEDFMILANEVVAEKLFWMEIPSVYRIHEVPTKEDIEKLNMTLGKFGYKIHDTEIIHPGKYQKILKQAENTETELLIRKVMLRSLQQAKYAVENLGHFGLASNYYTHFTSPIRRYSDLLVHRILGEAIGKYPNYKKLIKIKEELKEVTNHISQTERKAMKTEEESIKIKVIEYMSDKIGEVYDGIVSGIIKNGIFIMLSNQVECFFDIKNSPKFYTFDEKNYKMLEKNSNKVYNLGENVKIIITKVDILNLKIDVAFYEGENNGENYSK